MWNDGYSKEQPWLNYFNSYERMHCCFGDDDGGDSDAGAGDEAANTSTTGAAATSAAESQAAYSDAMTGPGPDLGEPDDFDARDATYNMGVGTAEQPDTFDFAQDTKSDNFAADVASIGFENFENPGDLDLATMNEMYNNPDAYGMGYNDFVDMGYFDKAEAADYAQSKAEAAALEASYKDKGKDVSISVAKDGTYSYTGKDAGTVGLSEMGKGLSYAMGSTGIGGLISGIARTLGITEEEVTAQDISMVTGGQNYGGLREESISSKQEKDSKGIAGPAIDRASYNSVVDAALGAQGYKDFNLGLDQRANQDYPNAMAPDPFNNYADAMEEADAAMFSGNYAGQPDEMGFNNNYDEGGEDNPTILPLPPVPEPEEKKEPETAMEAYFTKLGIASPAAPAGPVAPSSFQEYRSYLPPIGPADNAAYRRKLALGTPRYMEPSGPNPSISTLAAVYGLTYEEAAKKFAFPSVPKPPLADEQKVIMFAASGGGLNSLMRYK